MLNIYLPRQTLLQGSTRVLICNMPIIASFRSEGVKERLEPLYDILSAFFCAADFKHLMDISTGDILFFRAIFTPESIMLIKLKQHWMSYNVITYVLWNWLGLWLFNATFNNISVISGVHREKSTCRHSLTLTENEYASPCVGIKTDCINLVTVINATFNNISVISWWSV